VGTSRGYHRRRPVCTAPYLIFLTLTLFFPSGRVLLCVYPSADSEAILSVKWHPRQPDQLAVGSENKIHFLNILDALHVFGGEPIPATELHRIGPVFSMPSVSSFSFQWDTLVITQPRLDSLWLRSTLTSTTTPLVPSLPTRPSPSGEFVTWCPSGQTRFGATTFPHQSRSSTVVSSLADVMGRCTSCSQT
jgi:hypothetical protein